MSEVKIEKNIPYTGGAHAALNYPYAKMTVGDSFFVAFQGVDSREKARKQSALLNNAKAWKGRTGNHAWQFRTAQVEGGVRIWRVA
jgi:hypothetical protein